MTISRCHIAMYKNRIGSRNNITGLAIRKLRLSQDCRMSQRVLAERLQLEGLDLDKNAIQKIESGQRFVTDIELVAFSKVFDVPISTLYEEGLLSLKL